MIKMSRLKVSLLLTVFLILKFEVESQSIEQADFLVAEAIKEFFIEYFAKKEPKVDIFYSGPSSKLLAEKLLREKIPEVNVCVTEFEESATLEIENPSIFLFDSGQHLLKVAGIQVWRGVKSAQIPNHLIYAPTKGQDDVIKTLSKLKIRIENQNFIRVVNSTRRSVELVTNFFYTPATCGSYDYVTINQFSTADMKWQSESFFPEKYENFHDCSLNLYVCHAHSELNLQIFKILAHQLNFTIVPTKTITGVNVDSTACLTGITLNAYTNFEFTSAVYSDEATFTVPQGEPYTMLQKMFLMFDEGTWICIIVTLGGAFFIIQVINFMSVHIQTFVFGRNVHTPSMNLADIF